MTEGKVTAFMRTMQKVKFGRGQVVFEEGTIPEAVYIVQKGSFELVKKLSNPDVRRSTALNESLD